LTTVFSRAPAVLLATAALVVVACGGGGGGSPGPASVGGLVSGLSGSGLVLADNGSDHLTIKGNGSFVFTVRLPAGSAYSVSIYAQPTNPIQVCAVKNDAGKAGTANVTNIGVTCVTPTMSLLAGNLGGMGTADGVGADARFSSPAGVAADRAGNLYVADGNETIRKITPAGVVTTFAGQAGQLGANDGVGTEARFSYLSAVAADAAGNVYVADGGAIRKITPAGVVTTLAGKVGVQGSADGTGAAAQFGQEVRGLATDAAGNIYAADTFNSLVRKISPTGVVTTLAGVAGSNCDVPLCYPQGIATDTAGNVFVADEDDTIRRITPDGVVTLLAGSPSNAGSADGVGAEAQFNFPYGLAIDPMGDVYVADYDNGTIRKITPGGVVTTLAGTAGVLGSTDGTGAVAQFHWPQGIATDASGNVYVADTDNSTIRSVTPAGVVTTLAGQAAAQGSADGMGAAAEFNGPRGIATDAAGSVYVADTGNETIRRITPAGTVTTLAGHAGSQGSADGMGAAAEFNGPRGIATDATGNVYVGDTGNYAVRRITPAGAVSTIAAMLDSPAGIATDTAGNAYVADVGNYVPDSKYPGLGYYIDCTIQKITPAAVVTRLAGASGQMCGSEDGIGGAALFDIPEGVATDAAGNVYVADTGNCTIRMITPAGVVTTIAGQAARGSADGVAGAAQFNAPEGVAMDAAGDIYVADTGNSTIRKITPAGVVSTVVGVPGQTGFVAGTLPGIIGQPTGVAISGNSLYITTYNGVIVVHDVP
jgi:sugar lactone lactonase YvrE